MTTLLIDFNDMTDDDIVSASVAELPASDRDSLHVGQTIHFCDVEGGLGTAEILAITGTRVQLRADMETFSWDASIHPG